MTVVPFPPRGRFANPSYEPGDLVELIVGSPHMVVVDVCEDCGEVETVYTDSVGDITFNTFPAIVLQAAE